MDRNIWKRTLTKNYCPAWPCPICKKDTVKLIKDSLVQNEDRKSKDYHFDDGWDPDWTSYTFVAWARCNNSSCKQDFAISGTGGVQQGYDDEGTTWEDYFTPHSCAPMPHIIKIPKATPEDVTADLLESFSLFWSHRPSCANAIRYALERLMTNLGIPATQQSPKNSKLIDLTLHQRIEIYAKAEPQIGHQLMALKWLGNTGSHGERINIEDLLDAFEILEHSLEEILDNKSKKIADLAKKMTQNHS